MHALRNYLPLHRINPVSTEPVISLHGLRRGDEMIVFAKLQSNSVQVTHHVPGYYKNIYSRVTLPLDAARELYAGQLSFKWEKFTPTEDQR